MLSLILALMLPLAPGASAQPGGASQAALLVGRAFEAVSAPVQRGEEPELRRSRVERAGHRILGRGFNETEAAAILALMEDWLKRAPEARSSSAGTQDLLAEAARNAHPDIRDGKGTRNAMNWARFVLEISQKG